MPTVKRRLQLTGKATFILSMPKKWAKRIELKQGDELEIREERDGSLLVRKPVAEHGEMALVELDGVERPEAIQRMLIARYLQGYAGMRIRSRAGFDSGALGVIRQQSSRLLGLHITKESEDAVEIRDFFERSGVSIYEMLERAYDLARGMQANAFKAILEGDEAAASLVVSTDNDVDKLNFFIARQLNMALSDPAHLSELGLAPPECLEILVVASSVEAMADTCAELAGFAAKGPALPSDVRDFLQDSNGAVKAFHELAMTAFRERNFRLASELVSERPKLSRRLRKSEHGMLLEHTKLPELFTASVDGLQRIVGYGGEIAKVALNRE